MYEITIKKKASKELRKLPSVVLPKVASSIDDIIKIINIRKIGPRQDVYKK